MASTINGSGNAAPEEEVIPPPAVASSSSKPRQRKLGYQHASLLSLVTYSFVEPLLSLGAKGQIDEDTAEKFLPDSDRAEVLAARFEAAYAAETHKNNKFALNSSSSGLVWRTLFRLYRWRLLEHIGWASAESTVRVLAPLALRQLLDWLVTYEKYTEGVQGVEKPASGTGWQWAALLGLAGYLYTLIHHQLFWRGMRMGLSMRQQAVAAVQAKVLRLNAVSVSDVTAGRVVNLVSNDVRRFDESATFWVFLIVGPLELVAVLVLVGLRLGFPASVAGVSTLLLLIPAQAGLVRYIGRLRAFTAAQTDERVRLVGEAVSGILAAKMMGWEELLLAQTAELRKKEARYIRRMARIKAINMALSWAMTPLVALIAFATARATGVKLTVGNVFYSLALLSLPKLYICDFFVHAVEALSELRISVRRIAEFLALPEPPEPWHARKRRGGAANGGGSAHSKGAAGAAENFNGTAPSTTTGTTSKDSADVTVAINCASFDWADRSWAGQPPPPQGKGAQPPTLQEIDLQVPRGTLVAVVGAVGSGKSSLLAALLGELQPLPAEVRQQPTEGGESVAPVEMYGSVAYCQQIPWIVSGTINVGRFFFLDVWSCFNETSVFLLFYIYVYS
jgi:ABC-type multidrug transport system fused ATPase/permease subunit